MIGRAYKDLTGMVFGRVNVIGRADKRAKDKCLLWMCRCECGNTFMTRGQSLTTGNTKSCGCLRRELSKRSIQDLSARITRREDGRFTLRIDN